MHMIWMHIFLMMQHNNLVNCYSNCANSVHLNSQNSQFFCFQSGCSSFSTSSWNNQRNKTRYSFKVKNWHIISLIFVSVSMHPCFQTCSSILTLHPDISRFSFPSLSTLVTFLFIVPCSSDASAPNLVPSNNQT